MPAKSNLPVSRLFGSDEWIVPDIIYPLETGIYQANCLHVLDRFKPNTIPVCVTDPPYGIEYQSKWTHNGERKTAILNDDKPYTDWIKPLYEKMAPGGRLVCFYRWDVQNEFVSEILDAGFEIKNQLVWDKKAHTAGDLKGQHGVNHELMLYATKGRYEFRGRRPSTVYHYPRITDNNKLIHPNQKPVGLIGKILTDISSIGELVVDPFGGSFSTFRACQALERPCISTELHPEHFRLGSFDLGKHVRVLT